MHRTPRTTILVVAAVIGMLVGAVAPAGAVVMIDDYTAAPKATRAVHRTDKAPSDNRPDAVRPDVVRPDVVRPDVVRPDVRPERPDVRPVDTRPDIKPEPPTIDVLKLECSRVVHTDSLKAVGCHWSANDRARSYELWRIVNRGEREPVGKFGSETLEARDQLPAETVVARYAVLARGRTGEIVARSRVVTVEFRQEPPVVEALKLECERIPADGAKAAACHWSGTDQARAYQLWRMVNRGERELVGTFDNETFSTRDLLPRNTVVAKYAVIALNGEKEIVGRSRVTVIEFPTDRPTDPTVDRPVDIAPDRPATDIAAVRTEKGAADRVG